MNTLQPGDTFRATDHRDEEHLWIVLCVDASTDRVLIVNFTSYGEGKDGTCVIDASEHEWLTHRSCVPYALARTPALASVILALRNRRLRKDVPVSAALLDRIVKGAAVSENLKPEARELLRSQGLI